MFSILYLAKEAKSLNMQKTSHVLRIAAEAVLFDCQDESDAHEYLNQINHFFTQCIKMNKEELTSLLNQCEEAEKTFQRKANSSQRH